MEISSLGTIGWEITFYSVEEVTEAIKVLKLDEEEADRVDLLLKTAVNLGITFNFSQTYHGHDVVFSYYRQDGRMSVRFYSRAGGDAGFSYQEVKKKLSSYWRWLDGD